ncbi:hypothetical protein R6Z07F_012227 [Ovis aries]
MRCGCLNSDITVGSQSPIQHQRGQGQGTKAVGPGWGDITTQHKTPKEKMQRKQEFVCSLPRGGGVGLIVSVSKELQLKKVSKAERLTLSSDCREAVALAHGRQRQQVSGGWGAPGRAGHQQQECHQRALQPAALLDKEREIYSQSLRRARTTVPDLVSRRILMLGSRTRGRGVVVSPPSEELRGVRSQAAETVYKFSLISATAVSAGRKKEEDERRGSHRRGWDTGQRADCLSQDLYRRNSDLRADNKQKEHVNRNVSAF